MGMFSLPIILAQASQSIVNLTDSALVKGLGDSALVAVGLGSWTAYALQSLLLGFEVGVQVLVARKKGENNLAELTHPLMAGLLVSLVGGIPPHPYSLPPLPLHL